MEKLITLREEGSQLLAELPFPFNSVQAFYGLSKSHQYNIGNIMNLISPAELSYITDSLFAENRLDGRSLLQFREIHVSTQVISQSAGSARVACAGTDVLVGIRLETRDAKNDQDADEGKAVQISLVV